MTGGPLTLNRMSLDVAPPPGRRLPMLSAPGGCWPTVDQVLLPRAGLFDLHAARVACERWRERNTLETADRASLRLLPLVYRNLRSAQLDAMDLDRLKGAYRAAWFRNQLLFKHAAEALRAL